MKALAACQKFKAGKDFMAYPWAPTSHSYTSPVWLRIDNDLFWSKVLNIFLLGSHSIGGSLLWAADWVSELQVAKSWIKCQRQLLPGEAFIRIQFLPGEAFIGINQLTVED